VALTLLKKMLFLWHFIIWVEWTRIQLQWRVDALKELKELADRQLPGLLKEYCLNPDGTDMKPEECTIER
jgi:hypothetical protein